MKKIALIIVLIGPLNSRVSSQSLQAINVVNTITVKLKDSLNLSQKLADRLYKINMEIARKKKESWVKYNDREALRKSLQLEENKRDSLYEMVLPPEKYALYIKIKHSLIQAGEQVK